MDKTGNFYTQWKSVENAGIFEKFPAYRCGKKGDYPKQNQFIHKVFHNLWISWHKVEDFVDETCTAVDKLEISRERRPVKRPCGEDKRHMAAVLLKLLLSEEKLIISVLNGNGIQDAHLGEIKIHFNRKKQAIMIGCRMVLIFRLSTCASNAGGTDPQGKDDLRVSI